ncbi:MAG: hypothetical protein Hens2KO_25660 [Henriciella sp.]
MRIIPPLSAVAAILCSAGVANALGLENLENVSNPVHAYPVADALDFTSGISETVEVGFGPSGGAFPSQTIRVYVDVTGGTFSSPLTGAEVIIPGGTSVISTGGLKGQSSVSFIVSGANLCAADTSAVALDTSCSLNIPMDLDGSDVTVSVGLETNSGAAVDNSSQENRVSLKVIETAPPFEIRVEPSGTPVVADIASPNGAYTDIVGNDFLGVLAALPNAVLNPTTKAFETVNSDFIGTDVGPANAGAVTFTLTGEQDAFDTLAGGTLLMPGTGTITPNAATDIATGTLLFGSLQSIFVLPDGTVPIARSKYEVSVSIAAATTGPIQQAFSGMGNLEPIVRNGAAIVFPWTQSETQGAASGTTSVYRIGNLSSLATNAVLVEVRNSSEANYENPGLVQLAPSIASDAEFVTNSRKLEAALGNYGRGDLAFYVEFNASDLTGRQFIIRNGDLQQVKGGTIEEDLE